MKSSRNNLFYIIAAVVAALAVYAAYNCKCAKSEKAPMATEVVADAAIENSVDVIAETAPEVRMENVTEAPAESAAEVQAN